MRKKKIRVIVADDIIFLRDGLIDYLNNHEMISVIDSALHGEELIAKTKEKRPDVVVTDLIMPGLTGPEIVTALSEYTNRIVVYTMLDNQAVLLHILNAGALSYVVKGMDREEVVNAVLSTFNFRPHLCETSRANFEEMMKLGLLANDGVTLDISALEFDIIRKICEEKTSDEIARELFKGRKLIDRKRTDIFEKLNVKGTVGLVKFAMKNLLVPWVTDQPE